MGEPAQKQNTSRSRVSSDVIDQIRAKINHLEIVGEYVVLRKSGGNYTGLCPFHAEKTPSFSVNAHKPLYHCYGCNRGGDIFHFVMEIQGISFPEAIKELALKAGVPLPKNFQSSSGGGTTSSSDTATKELNTARKLNRFVAAFYHGQLLKTQSALDYLSGRKISKETIDEFYLGYSPSGWDALSRHLIEKNAPVELAEKYGLIRKSKKAAEMPDAVPFFDLFRERVLFPVLDRAGKVAGFGGRGMKADAQPKYLNTPDTPLFQKSKLLYGMFQAQKYIRDKDRAIIVEGYFDTLAMHQAGFKNTVAICGTALTAEHLRMLRKMASEIVLLLDSDKAGIAATERAMELGLSEGLILFGAFLPEKKDPDEFLQSPDGVENMKKLLLEAKPLLDVRMGQAIEYSKKGTYEKTIAVKKISTWLGAYTDPIGRQIRFEEASHALGVSIKVLGGQGGGSSSYSAPSPKKLSEKTKPSQTKPSQVSSGLAASDRVLIYALARRDEYKEVFHKLDEILPAHASLVDLFQDPETQKLLHHLSTIQSKFEGSTRMTLSLNEKSFSDPFQLLGSIRHEIRSILTESWMENKPKISKDEVWNASLRALERYWARFSHQIGIALVEAEARQDVVLEENLKKDYLDVQRRIKEFQRLYEKTEF